MKRNSLIFGVLCSLMVVTMVSSTLVGEQVQATRLFTSERTVKTTPPAVPQVKAELFVTISSGKFFYKAWVCNENGKIQIKILNEHLIQKDLCFQKKNNLVFIDAVQNYILVKEVSSDKKILAYWVIKIVYDTKDCKFWTDCFSVNPRVNSNFYHLQQDYVITKILELDVSGEWISVIDQSSKYLDVYKINVHDKLNTLITVAWFELCGEKITGGNSRVLYDQSKDQFKVDPQVCQDPNCPTEYKSVPVCKLTNLPLYDKKCTKIIELIGWAFQYVSQSNDKKCATTFLYRGYGDKKIKGAENLKSSVDIKYISDNYHFFIAITNCDVYVTRVEWSKSSEEYKYFAGLLSKSSVADKDKIFKIWKEIDIIVFIKGKFYFLADDKFYVFGKGSSPFQKIHESPCVSKSGNLTQRLFKEIRKYVDTPPK